MLAVQKDNYSFIGMNDGIFSLVFNSEATPENAIVINSIEEASPGFDLETIAFASAHLLGGDPLNELGFPPTEYRIKSSFLPVIEEDVLRGIVMYIDDFGNVVTNITLQLFEQQCRNRKFEIVTRKLANSINVISRHYHETNAGGMMAIFNSGGYLEIAINQGSASSLLGLKLSDNIRIEFK
jgi:S-adenosylmethionine hydrolase